MQQKYDKVLEKNLRLRNLNERSYASYSWLHSISSAVLSYLISLMCQLPLRLSSKSPSCEVLLAARPYPAFLNGTYADVIVVPQARRHHVTAGRPSVGRAPNATTRRTTTLPTPPTVLQNEPTDERQKETLCRNTAGVTC
jgi:hypothetical protein